MRLEIRRRFILLPKVNIIDQFSGVKIGRYVLPYILSDRFDKLVMGEETYASLFRKDTWGHYKFGLSSERERIEYAFKIDLPSGMTLKSISERPFEGSIDVKSNNMPVVLAGLYLIERQLHE